MTDNPHLVEKLQVLLGERGGAGKVQRAVRVSDLANVMPISQKMQSTQIAGAPSIEDYNRLQADIANLYDVVTALSRVAK